MIGRASLHHSLYILDTTEQPSIFVHSFSVTTKYNVWHSRLGHPAHVKLTLLQNEWPLSDFILSMSPRCEVCHKAKQKGLSFPSSNNLSPNAFDLVHIDTWGPFKSPPLMATNIFLLSLMTILEQLGYTK